MAEPRHDLTVLCISRNTAEVFELSFHRSWVADLPEGFRPTFTADIWWPLSIKVLILLSLLLRFYAKLLASYLHVELCFFKSAFLRSGYACSPGYVHQFMNVPAPSCLSPGCTHVWSDVTSLWRTSGGRWLRYLLFPRRSDVHLLHATPPAILLAW